MNAELHGDRADRRGPLSEPAFQRGGRRKRRAGRHPDRNAGQLTRDVRARPPAEDDPGARDDRRRELDLRGEKVRGVGVVLRQHDAVRVRCIERPAVERQLDRARPSSQEALPRQARRHGATLRVRLEKERRLGGGTGNVQPLLGAGDLAAAGVEGARHELVRLEVPAQVEIRGPRLFPGGARGPAVHLEGDPGRGSLDRDADGMSSENETQEERGEGDRGHGKLWAAHPAMVVSAVGRRTRGRVDGARFLGRSVMREIQSPNPSLAWSTR